jgi:outer membrane protein assembly factor BamA
LNIFLDRDDAIATRSIRGVTGYAIWPLNHYARLEVFGGMSHYNEEYSDPAVEAEAQRVQEEIYGTTIFRNGRSYPLGLAFTQETTVFREYGPVAGSTMRASYEFAPKLGESLSRQTAELDARYYMRLASNGVLALRAKGFKSWGDFPDFTFFGGNSEMRGYNYLSFVGQQAFFANAELRFPLIEAMLTPLGVMGGLRGTLFFNVGANGYDKVAFTPWTSSSEQVDQLVDIIQDPITGEVTPIFVRANIDGFRLVDARASYGIGLQTFALGFPMHFDWSWRTLFNKGWEDLLFARSGGSTEFRKPRFSFWIGYDF